MTQVTNISREDLAWRTRQRVADKVRALRRGRRWTQADLARLLRISQGQLSKLERAEGSFTAEQLLEVLRIFNVPVEEFGAGPPDQRPQGIQNALARHGASHLWESVEPGPSSLDATSAIEAALVEGDARLVTAVAPVLVKNADVIHLQRLAADLARAGLERRLWWAIDSTLEAIDEELEARPPRATANLYRRARVVLGRYVDAVRHTRERAPDTVNDILDPVVRTNASVGRLIAASSPIAKRWGIVTSIHTYDFTLALRAAHVAD